MSIREQMDKRRRADLITWAACLLQATFLGGLMFLGGAPWWAAFGFGYLIFLIGRR